MKLLIKNVLVAYNGSASSLRAVKYGIMFCRQNKCSLTVVYVVDVAAIKMLTLSKFMIASEGEKVREHLLNDGKKEMQFVSDLAKSKGLFVETEIRQGAVWSEVISCADEKKTDVIFLGGSSASLARNQRGHSVISSQNREIIGSAHCSVMVVKEEMTDQLFKLF